MAGFRLTLNMMTLFGLALGIGMLVDNSIVVLDNVEVYLGEGRSLLAASKDGSGEMMIAIVASTITTVVVFLPILSPIRKSSFSMEGSAGRLPLASSPLWFWR